VLTRSGSSTARTSSSAPSLPTPFNSEPGRKAYACLASPPSSLSMMMRSATLPPTAPTIAALYHASTMSPLLTAIIPASSGQMRPMSCASISVIPATTLMPIPPPTAQTTAHGSTTFLLLNCGYLPDLPTVSPPSPHYDHHPPQVTTSLPCIHYSCGLLP